MRISMRRLASASMLIYGVVLLVLGSSDGMGVVLVAAAALVASCFFLALLKGSAIAGFQWFWIPYALFCAWGVTSLTWSFEPQTGRALTLVQVTLIGLVCAQMLAKTGSIRIFEIAFYIGVIASLFLSSGQVGGESERQGGTLGHANDLATAIAGAALLGARRAALLLKEPKVKITHLILVIIVFSVCFYLAFYSAGSRRAIIVLGLSGLFVFTQWAFAARTLMRRVAAAVGSVALVIIALPLLIESTFFFRLESLASYLSGGDMIREQSLGVRSGMAEEAISLWLSSPFSGVGLDNFRVVGSYGTYSHNNYLEILSGLGVVGLLLYYSSIAFVMLEVRKGRVKGVGSLALDRQWLLFVGSVILLTDTFSVSYYDKVSWLLLSVFLGYGTWLSRQAKSYRFTTAGQR